MSVGMHIKNLREAKCWSKAALARELTKAKGRTVPRESVSRWESGDDHPQRENIKALAKVFDRPEREFEEFGGGDTGRPSVAGKRTIPLLSWLDLKHVGPEGIVARQALRKAPEIEVDDAVPDHAYALTIQDTSMSDRFMPGDEIIIDPKVEPVHDAADPDFVLVRLTTGQVIFRQYVLRAPGAFDLVGLNPRCKTESVTPNEPAELLGTMIEHRRKRRRR